MIGAENGEVYETEDQRLECLDCGLPIVTSRE